MKLRQSLLTFLLLLGALLIFSTGASAHPATSASRVHPAIQVVDCYSPGYTPVIIYTYYGAQCYRDSGSLNLNLPGAEEFDANGWSGSIGFDPGNGSTRYINFCNGWVSSFSGQTITFLFLSATRAPWC